ncbi:MAG: peptidoglycan DD-metalloendopeptidase family protein [Cyanobacteria bacterium J06627_3]
MADFCPLSTASSKPEKSDHSSSEVIYKHPHGQLWKKIGFVGSVAVMGGQPVLAQIDMPVGDAVAPPIAADTAVAVAPAAPEIVVPVAPPVVVSPEAAAPVFSTAAPEAPAIAAPPEVEAITSQVEIVIPTTEAVAPDDAGVASDGVTSDADVVTPEDVVMPDGGTPEAVAPPVEATTEATTPGVEIVKPSDVVPDEIPTVEDLASEFGGVFIDATEYDEGATLSPDAPEVFVSERSTGCEYKVDADNIDGCGTADGQPTVVAGTPRAAAPGPSINIGPVNISRSGVSFSGGATTVAGREYYNTVAKPLVELQAGESFVFPLASPSPITSLFGWRWHPIHNDYRFHAGTDLGAPQGTPILATQSGQVSLADYLGGYGLTVILRHNDNTLESRYAHMSHILVKPGEWVEQGEAIGLVGSTGNSTGPHLHFELHQLTSQGWTAISPNEVLSYALANLNNGIGGGVNPLQALNIMPKAQAAQGKASLPDAIKTETLVTDAPPFRPAQPNAQ